MKRLYLGCIMLILLVTGCNFRQLSEPLLQSVSPTVLTSPSSEKPTSSSVVKSDTSLLEVNRNDPESVALAFTYAFIGNDLKSIKELWGDDVPPSQDSVGFLLINGKPPEIYERPRVEDGSLRPGKTPDRMYCDVLAKVQTWDGAFWFRFDYTLFNQTGDEWVVVRFSQPVFQGADDPTLKSDYLRTWKTVSFPFTFEQELEPNRWLVIPTTSPEMRGIVQFSFNQIELATFKNRFTSDPLKGATFIVKGEDGGLDDLGRRIFIVKGNSGLIPPEMP